MLKTLLKLSKPKIDFFVEDGIYWFSYQDENWLAVTEWKTIDEFLYNIRECLECHFGEDWFDFTKLQIPYTLFQNNLKYNSHAIDLQTC